MKNTDATTPEEYLAALPPERREVVSVLRDLILRSLPTGYEEEIRWGMLSYEVPLSRYPKTYNGEPLLYAALAAQKHHFSLYLMGIYSQEGGVEELRKEFRKAGMKFDMGKSCLRFRRVEGLPLDVLARTVASTSVDDFIALYEESRKKVKR